MAWSNNKYEIVFEPAICHGDPGLRVFIIEQEEADNCKSIINIMEIGLDPVDKAIRTLSKLIVECLILEGAKEENIIFANKPDFGRSKKLISKCEKAAMQFLAKTENN